MSVRASSPEGRARWLADHPHLWKFRGSTFDRGRVAEALKAAGLLSDRTAVPDTHVDQWVHLARYYTRLRYTERTYRAIGGGFEFLEGEEVKRVMAKKKGGGKKGGRC